MTDLPPDEELPPTDEVIVEDEELDVLDLEDDPAYNPEDEDLRRMKGG